MNQVAASTSFEQIGKIPKCIKNYSSHIPFLNCKKWVILGVFMQPFSCLQKGLQMIHGG